MPPNFDAAFGNFLIEFTIDSTDNFPGSGEFSYTIPFKFPLGIPEVLIVDNDGGQDVTGDLRGGHEPDGDRLPGVELSDEG